MTWSGFCIDDAIKRAGDNNDQLAAHAGPFFDHWRRQMAASVGGVLLDDVGAGGHTQGR